MASILKRKRGSTQGIEALKRAKATTNTLEADPEPIQSSAGWDAAFAPITKNNELATLNGSGADKEDLESSDAEDYEQFAKKEEVLDTPKKKRSKAKAPKTTKSPEWKVSAPIGGRMIDVDTVFTEDEKYGHTDPSRSLQWLINTLDFL